MQELLKQTGQILKTFIDNGIALLNIDDPLLNVAIGFTIIGFAITIIEKMKGRF